MPRNHDRMVELARRYREGATLAALAEEVGVSRQRIHQLIKKSGEVQVPFRPMDQDIDRILDRVRATGEQNRGAIIAEALRIVKEERLRITAVMVRRRITERWEFRRAIPPIGVPDFHLYCSVCATWHAPEHYGTSMCRACAVHRAGTYHKRKARKNWTAEKKRTFRADFLARKKAEREAILQAVGQFGIEAAAVQFGLSPLTVRRNMQRARAERAAEQHQCGGETP